jgi:hypothetical protein
MAKFYLVSNVNGEPPLAVKSHSYVHVKVKFDRTATAIITHDELSDPNTIEKTQEELQAIVNSWVDEENTDPFFDEVNQVYVVQNKINLGVLLG